MSRQVRLYARAETPVTTELLRELLLGAVVRPSRHPTRRDRRFVAGWVDLEIRVNILRGDALRAHARALLDVLPPDSEASLREHVASAAQLVELTFDPLVDARTERLVAELARRLDAEVVDPLRLPHGAIAA